MQTYRARYKVLDESGEYIRRFDADNFAHATEQAVDATEDEEILLGIDAAIYYIHKYEVQQAYGGPEEGGWWYDVGTPVEVGEWKSLIFRNEEEAYERCRALNDEEYERRKRDEVYDYTSVLAYRSTFYTYSVEEDAEPQPYPQERPHYE